MSKQPDADALLNSVVAAKQGLSSLPPEAWMAKVASILSEPEVDAALLKISAISDALPDGYQGTAILRQFAQAALVAKQLAAVEAARAAG